MGGRRPVVDVFQRNSIPKQNNYGVENFAREALRSDKERNVTIALHRAVLSF